MSRSRTRVWFQKHSRDPYVRQARSAHYRARSVFKLREIDRREKLFHPGQTVLDLGAAPGSWSQYVSERIRPGGRLLAVDRLEIAPIEGVTILRGDLMSADMSRRCLDWLGDRRADLAISDAGPNLTGIAVTDQANMIELAGVMTGLACQTLACGGHFLIKLFQGEDVAAYVQDLREYFQQVVTRKPAASQDASREIYVLARGYNV